VALMQRSLHARFGVEVFDVDGTRVDESNFKEVAEAGQRLTDQEQIAFSRASDHWSRRSAVSRRKRTTLPEISLPANEYRVEKMKFGRSGKTDDRTTIEYNSRITVSGVPTDAYPVTKVDRPVAS